MTPEQPYRPSPMALATPSAQMSAESIDAALIGIEDLEAVPLAEHVGRFDAVHSALTDALSAIDRV
ncbi:hypothetical protein NLX83_26295 [Allokutzneria sp. A3M-2-11 16]|uniref:hypothetical protein n=1 Tax=Allokutzneria sp. A3M-2-11 16 TaxID=2962043 RepID=UPI0020B72962|nr:hypothetical protein [Allokutzneria sp. A3M-2-11 16]MCP3802790.1 hypothetical protein [Allokutzneria sp. A3M-2-11 16]